jgi:hypothetical protein
MVSLISDVQVSTSIYVEIVPNDLKVINVIILLLLPFQIPSFLNPIGPSVWKNTAGDAGDNSFNDLS